MRCKVKLAACGGSNCNWESLSQVKDRLDSSDGYLNFLVLFNGVPRRRISPQINIRKEFHGAYKNNSSVKKVRCVDRNSTGEWMGRVEAALVASCCPLLFVI